MAQHRAGTETGVPFLEHPTEHPLEPGGFAFGRRHYRIVELERRAVADRAPRVLEFDPAALAGIERQLLELGSGQQPVAAEVFDQYWVASRLAVTRWAARLRGSPLRGRATIGVAADRRGVGRVLERPPQRR